MLSWYFTENLFVDPGPVSENARFVNFRGKTVGSPNRRRLRTTQAMDNYRAPISGSTDGLIQSGHNGN